MQLAPLLLPLGQAQAETAAQSLVDQLGNALDVGLRLAVVLGFFLYAIVRMGLDTFYRQFEVSCEEVGLTQATILGRAAIYLSVLFVSACAAATVVAVPALIDLWFVSHSLQHAGVVLFVTIEAGIVLAGLSGFVGIFYSNRARKDFLTQLDTVMARHPELQSTAEEVAEEAEVAEEEEFQGRAPAARAASRTIASWDPGQSCTARIR